MCAGEQDAADGCVGHDFLQMFERAVAFPKVWTRVIAESHRGGTRRAEKPPVSGGMSVV
jgi:hypothetical protein